MKNFKRILDSTGQYRYYVNGKRITAKKGASQFVKQNFSQLKPEQLNRQEKKVYEGKLFAQRGAEKAKERAKQAYRFKGKFLDKGVSQFFQKLKKEQKNVEKLYPGIKDYGQLLKELQKDLKENMDLFKLNDASQYGLPNEKRNRLTLENTADVIETLKNDFPGYKLRVITESGDQINDYRQAIKYIAEWEGRIISSNEDSAYIKISYFPIIDIVNKLLIIDLEEQDKEDDNRFSAQVMTS